MHTSPPSQPGPTPPEHAPAPPHDQHAGNLTIGVAGTTAHASKAKVEPEAPGETTAADKPSKSAEGKHESRVSAPSPPASILAVDIGGTKVKFLATGQVEPVKAPTGRGFTPAKLVETVRSLAKGWEYEAVSIGYPGLVGQQGPRAEPGNLGPGWVGFDFAAAFGKPVKIINDAAMQALGSYEGGRMLFLGLGTGLGSTLITGHMIVPLELGQLRYDSKRTLSEVLGRRGLAHAGKSDWRKMVQRAVTALAHAFVTDYIVIGGGNAKNVKDLPPGARRGHNLTAFRGGFRLWSVEDVWVLAATGGESTQPTIQGALRML